MSGVTAVSVYITEEQYNMVRVTPETTSGQVCKHVIRKRNLKQANPYALFYQTGGQEVKLDNEEGVLDAIRSLAGHDALDGRLFLKPDTNDPAEETDSDEDDMFNTDNKSEDADFSGFLMKQGGINKAWKERFFEIQKGQLVYRVSKGGRRRGAIPLKAAVVEPCHREGLWSCRFQIKIPDTTRVFHLKADEYDTMIRWIRHIRKHSTVTAENRAFHTIQHWIQRVEGNMSALEAAMEDKGTSLLQAVRSNERWATSHFRNYLKLSYPKYTPLFTFVLESLTPSSSASSSSSSSSSPPPPSMPSRKLFEDLTRGLDGIIGPTRAGQQQDGKGIPRIVETGSRTMTMTSTMTSTPTSSSTSLRRNAVLDGHEDHHVTHRYRLCPLSRSSLENSQEYAHHLMQKCCEEKAIYLQNLIDALLIPLEELYARHAKSPDFVRHMITGTVTCTNADVNNIRISPDGLREEEERRKREHKMQHQKKKYRSRRSSVPDAASGLLSPGTRDGGAMFSSPRSKLLAVSASEPNIIITRTPNNTVFGSPDDGDSMMPTPSLGSSLFRESPSLFSSSLSPSHSESSVLKAESATRSAQAQPQASKPVSNLMIAVEDDDDLTGKTGGSLSLAGGTKWGRDKGIFAKDTSENELTSPQETKASATATANANTNSTTNDGLLDDLGADLGEFLEGDDLLKDLTKDDDDTTTNAALDEDGGDLF